MQLVNRYVLILIRCIDHEWLLMTLEMLMQNIMQRITGVSSAAESIFFSQIIIIIQQRRLDKPARLCAETRRTMHAPLEFDFLLFHLCLSHSVELQHSGMMASLSMECANRCSPYWTVFLAWKEWKSSSQDVRNSPDGFSSFLLMEFYQLIWCIRAAMSASCC